MTRFHYPTVEVFVDHVETNDTEGGYDVVREVQVDGVRWPVTEVDWSHAGNSDFRGAIVTLKVRGKLRITEMTACAGT